MITIPKGKHYDCSLSRLYHRFVPFSYKKNKIITFEAQILTDPYDIRPDRDQNDIHKLCGINLNFWNPSDVNSIMTGFQANAEDATWDITPYVNDNKNFVPYSEVPTKAGDKVKSEFKMVSRNKIELRHFINGEPVSWNPYTYVWLKSKIRYPALILPWHGGKDNDGNGVGGVAPVDIKIYLNINK